MFVSDTSVATMHSTDTAPAAAGVIRVHRITRSESGSPLATPCWNGPFPVGTGTGSESLPPQAPSTETAPRATAAAPVRRRKLRRLVPTRRTADDLMRPMECYPDGTCRADETPRSRD